LALWMFARFEREAILVESSRRHHLNLKPAARVFSAR